MHTCSIFERSVTFINKKVFALVSQDETTYDCLLVFQQRSRNDRNGICYNQSDKQLASEPANDLLLDDPRAADPPAPLHCQIKY